METIAKGLQRQGFYVGGHTGVITIDQYVNNFAKKIVGFDGPPVAIHDMVVHPEWITAIASRIEERNAEFVSLYGRNASFTELYSALGSKEMFDNIYDPLIENQGLGQYQNSRTILGFAGNHYTYRDYAERFGIAGPFNMVYWKTDPSGAYYHEIVSGW